MAGNRRKKPLPEDFASYQREAKRRFLKRRKAGRTRKESYQYGRPKHAEPKGYADIRKPPKPVDDPRYICDNYKSQCRKCGYGSSHTIAGHINCNYILIEGHMRGCPVENCKRFRPGRNRVRKEYTFEGQWEVAFDDEEELGRPRTDSDRIYGGKVNAAGTYTLSDDRGLISLFYQSSDISRPG